LGTTGGRGAEGGGGVSDDMLDSSGEARRKLPVAPLIALEAWRSTSGMSDWPGIASASCAYRACRAKTTSSFDFKEDFCWEMVCGSR
jgi:hypothetical protein